MKYLLHASRQLTQIIIMSEKPTYEDLERRVRESEKADFKRKRAEKALRDSEDRFSKAFRSSPNPLLISTFEAGRCIDVNDVFLRSLGYNRKEIIGRTTQELKLWDKWSERSEMIQSLEKSNEVMAPVVMIRAKSGENRIMTISAAKIERKGEEYLITTAIDIIEQKQAEEALEGSGSWIGSQVE